MLLINLIRTLTILFGVNLFHIYIGEQLTVDEGVVVFFIAFFGLVLSDIVEDYTINYFNPNPKNRDQQFPR